MISGRAASASLAFTLGLTVELGTVAVDAAGAELNCHSSITRVRKVIVKRIENIARTGRTKILSGKGIECKNRAL